MANFIRFIWNEPFVSNLMSFNALPRTHFKSQNKDHKECDRITHNVMRYTSLFSRHVWVMPIISLLCPPHMHTKDFMSFFLFISRGQSYKTFYTLGRCKIKCLNCRINEKEKCNPKNMLGCSVLTLWRTKVCCLALFTCFRMRL